jgi:hypothetical protein
MMLSNYYESSSFDVTRLKKDFQERSVVLRGVVGRSDQDQVDGEDLDLDSCYSIKGPFCPVIAKETEERRVTRKTTTTTTRRISPPTSPYFDDHAKALQHQSDYGTMYYDDMVDDDFDSSEIVSSLWQRHDVAVAMTVTVILLLAHASQLLST